MVVHNEVCRNKQSVVKASSTDRSTSHCVSDCSSHIQCIVYSRGVAWCNNLLSVGTVPWFASPLSAKAQL